MSDNLGKWFDDLQINTWLKEQDYNLYCKVKLLASTFREKLNGKPWFETKVYTLHDFDHHEKNVLTYASFFVSRNVKEYSCEELFLFECACILHDLAMTCTYDHREVHSLIGALDTLGVREEVKGSAEKIFQEVYLQLRSILGRDDIKYEQIEPLFSTIKTQYSNWIPLSIGEPYQRELIAMIILGHSDIKISTLEGKFAIPTLNNSFYNGCALHTTTVNGASRTMCIQVLAALLRWADEMDCSCQRVGSNEPVFPDKMDDEQRYSKRCWDKLKRITSIELTTNPITLHFNATSSADYEMIYEVEEKLTKEWKNIYAVLSKHDIGKTCLYLGDFMMVGENEQQTQEYSNYKATRCEAAFTMHETKLDIDKIRKCIRQRVADNHLYKEGHYLLLRDPRLCVRNALDCSDILSDREILSMSAQAMINFIYTDSFEAPPEEFWNGQWCLIGVANSGAILASHIATLISAPYYYTIPKEKEGAYTKQEGIPDGEHWLELQRTEMKMVLVIGTNRTGTAIRNAIDMLHNGNHVELSRIKVVGLINRETTGGKGIVDELKEEGISCGFLMREYEIDICKYSDKYTCPYYKRCEEESK